MEQSSPFVLWFTGLSGSGKTTIAHKVYEEIKPRYSSCVFLDGDLFREILGNDLGHGPGDRLANAYRLARMCRYLARQNISVICATMSLFPEIWQWNRENIPGYLQIYIRVERETLLARDPKGLYRRALEGIEKNVVGVDLPFREPEGSHLILENNEHGPEAVARHVELVLSKIIIGQA